LRCHSTGTLALADATTQARPTALVVEDDGQIGQLIKFIVEREGFDVILAQDGRAAQEVMATALAPAVVLLDVMLPFVDGLQLVAEMRRHQTWKHCPAVMLSAKATDADRTRALAAGADAYLVKPFLPDDLRACLKNALGRVRQ
jgi:DNA-binding response OmpR family regulator